VSLSRTVTEIFGVK